MAREAPRPSERGQHGRVDRRDLGSREGRRVWALGGCSGWAAGAGLQVEREVGACASTGTEFPRVPRRGAQGLLSRGGETAGTVVLLKGRCSRAFCLCKGHLHKPTPGREPFGSCLDPRADRCPLQGNALWSGVCVVSLLMVPGTQLAPTDHGVPGTQLSHSPRRRGVLAAERHSPPLGREGLRTADSSGC